MDWLDKGKQITHAEVISTETLMNIKLPRSYIELIKNHDGGTPKKDTFCYLDVVSQKLRKSGIGAFLSMQTKNTLNMVYYFKQPAEYFPEGLIAFAQPGNGDFICFDYRKGKDNPDPPIVYWNHEADVGKEVSFVAQNFEEFLEMLQEPEDLEER